MAASLGFAVTHRSGGARRGRLRLARGTLDTPAFMPVGTRGAVKGLTVEMLQALGAEIVLANTYHLHLRPGSDLIASAGGLHAFMGWDRPILTDSGGYQVFSLASRRTVSEDGVVFRSHLDGRAEQLTPESAVDIQARLGSDVAMAFDECVSWPATHAAAEQAMVRTLRWARRARDRFLDVSSGGAQAVAVSTPGQAQFGIVQGGVYPDLRDRSVAGTLEVGFDGYAIGGLSVGEPSDVMYDVVSHTAAALPDALPRYLMGTGTPADLLESVARGIDLFDCVLPTRNARNGQLFTREGTLSIKREEYARDERPPDPACSCPTCRRHSRAYLRYLFVAGELNAAILNTIHNVHFYLDTMRAIGKAIEFGIFEDFKRDFLRTFARQPSALNVDA